MENGRINIGMVGFGTVGTGVARILLEHRELLRARLGAELVLKFVADIDTETDRGIRLDPGVLVSDARAVVDDPEIDIVLELIGGHGIAKELIERSLQNGKHVVTANKALLASQGNELFRLATEKSVELAYEAAVGGCMPIIKTLRESLVGNVVHTMTGILNGTCNYILSQITDEGVTYAAALAEAQKKGYAEADPTLDVEGMDTAHKLAILTALAYGMVINLEDIYLEGISKITPMDIQFADQFGYRIKLLAIGKDRGEAVEARVHPTMIPFDNLLSNVNGSVNAITLTGDAVGDILLKGRGAGMMPTASAVVSDAVDIARSLLTGGGVRIPPLSYLPERIRQRPVLPMDRLETHYYFRFAAVDKPGVLSAIAGILGKRNISLKSVHQKGRKTNGSVPVVMLTHLAREADVRAALREIQALDVVSDETMLIRIEDENDTD
ncbi:MAG: homoserine dehydrogenase [Desulfobacteraceae bacterium]|nr:homoserine dehydrogenase [Desulfobacteraceae bacterium]